VPEQVPAQAPEPPEHRQVQGLQPAAVPEQVPAQAPQPLEGNQVQELQPAAVPEQIPAQAPQPLEGNQVQELPVRDDDGANDPVFVPLQQDAQNPVLVEGYEVVLADKPIEF
jgi:hypothetical protein